MTSGDDCTAGGSIYFRNETCSFLVKHLGVCGRAGIIAKEIKSYLYTRVQRN
jgi:hypothetical protein